MVEIGQLQITGNLDTRDIEKGFVRIESQFDRVQTQAESSLGTFNKLGSSAARFGKSLVLIGTAGIGALTALATKSPVLAPTFARLQSTMLRLSNTAGQVLKPLFETFANELIPAIGTAIQNNEGIIGKFVNAASIGLSDLANLLSGNLQQIENLEAKLAGGALGAFIGGALGGPGGAIAGAGFGSIAGGAMVPSENQVMQSERDRFGVFAESAAVIREIKRQTREAQTGSDFAIAQLGGLGALGFNSVIDLIQFIFGRATRKDTEMASPSGVTR